MRSWTRDWSPEESRRLFAENQWAVAGFAVSFIAGLVAFFALRESSLPTAVWLLVGLVAAFIWGRVFRLWATKKLGAMRAENPPSDGGQHGGERPGG